MSFISSRRAGAEPFSRAPLSSGDGTLEYQATGGGLRRSWRVNNTNKLRLGTVGAPTCAPTQLWRAGELLTSSAWIGPKVVMKELIYLMSVAGYSLCGRRGQPRRSPHTKS